MLKKIQKRQYDHVFSIGEACFCATSLVRNGLRTASDPFDWSIGGSFATRIEMMISKFDRFIDLDDLEYLRTRHHPEPCNVYINTHNDIVFNHDFPLDVPLEAFYPKVQQKYQRRIDRFFKTVKDAKSVLAVYMELPDSQDGFASDEQIIAAARSLNGVFPDTDVDLLYLRHNTSLNDGGVVYNIDNENVILAEAYVAKRNAKSNNAVNKKNLSKVLSFVRCEGKWRRIIKKKIIYFPNRGQGYVSILGIKIKFKRTTKAVK